jgi:nitrous oxidase accessory protein
MSTRTLSPWRVLALLLLTIPMLAGLAQPATAADPDIPADATRVCASCETTDLTAAIAAAADGDTIVVEGGSFAGPIVIDKPLTLIGTDGATIDGHHQGTNVRITAPDVTLRGFAIVNSGGNFDKEDSAVFVDRGDRAQILDNQIHDALFGVNVAQSPGIVIDGNHIVGKDVDMGVRGDGIKVWYSHEAHIANNHVERSRDLLVWYSNNVVVSDNVVRDGRYGFHFMNSDDGTATHNQLIDNSVGIYLMYGKRFTITDNLLQGSRGPSGHGLGLKEIDGVDVEGNVIYDNRIGVYIDTSPLSPDVYNTFDTNLLAYNDIGLGMLPSATNNVFTRNSMVENLEQVTVLGGGPLRENIWSVDGVGNFWSDYAGYDADGDGIGDTPFRNEQLSEQLMSSWPILQLFRFSVAASAVDFGAKAVPVFRAEPIFEDAHPLVEPVLPANVTVPDRGQSVTTERIWSLALLALAAAAVWWGASAHRPARRTAASGRLALPWSLPLAGGSRARD